MADGSTVSVGSESGNIEKNLPDLYKDDGFIAGIKSDFPAIKKNILSKPALDVYHDPHFQATPDSVKVGPPKGYKPFVWKRPRDISKDPILIAKEIGPDDVVQGYLGDCWWVSSVAAICLKGKFITKISPTKDQSFAPGDYVGAFHFRFWRFGKWIDVVVDDRLPCWDSGELAFGSSGNKNEFWLPLLEKAYAKLHGNYKAISGGFATDALEDLTGGMAIPYNLNDETPGHLYSLLDKALNKGSFICCAIDREFKDTDRKGADKTTGLVGGHAYTVIGVKMARYNKGDEYKTRILKVRNSWGNSEKWKGKWSDRFNDHKSDGEWWMDFEDFKKYFASVTICTLGPDFNDDGAVAGDEWFLSKANGAWIKGVSAGGCTNEVEKFATNPQYYLELREPDDFDPNVDQPEAEGKCSFIIGLMQEYRRVGKAEYSENFYLGFSVYKMKDRPTSRLNVDYFRHNKEILTSGTYVNLREVCTSAYLSPGHYVVVPSTFSPDKVASFLIRIFTEKKINLGVL